ncbi:DeoR family transcriptional regulator [Aeromonas salmonicida subsp. salmonicida]|uniref:Transriptional regulator, DeoR family n=1 Tax=Aeromonas salmonicida (strain A449) TaxID=382245 RepID=A4SMQ7_AERS4|nr:YafY family protein [Aeromonas salmonicida]ABO90179.1 transriptional regulator, DeoR family [Aeromonas salmonicida subsp. salmonicida A449]ATD39192.1 DNA-binding transcriptional regulator [Aeromonas salmonicida subsp. masoucida]AYO63224.1 YafY family transcriptional regulator [Aeromonas salmonicida subsp. salmonicida 01-B526]TMX06071.1 YafY family transcriptional regulator [Aeromonas salmonicida subsp. achromogenes]ASI23307.1 YafY family transcriptional regulator [Aeromonas salmonicida]
MLVRKSDRLFQLTNLLRAHQPLTARELAERLCVSERTIYRYMDDLSLAGIPVYGEAGLGYRLSEGFELAPLQLSNAELEALITGVNLVAVLTGKGLADPARALLAKIEAALPERGPGRGQTPVVRVPDYRTARPEYVRWDKLHDAITAGHWLEIDYDDALARQTRRRIYPLGLFYWGGCWTLGAWCALRLAYRDFRVDRIGSLELCSKEDSVPTGVTLAKYLAVRQAENPLLDGASGG